MAWPFGEITFGIFSMAIPETFCIKLMSASPDRMTPSGGVLCREVLAFLEANMGLEAQCRATWRRESSAGKALLETDFVLFRGDFRVKVPFTALTGVRADGPNLRLEWPEGPASLELGEKAALKWADKIANPKSRIDKLDVKAESRVAMIDTVDAALRAELSARTQHVNDARAARSADLLFYTVRDRSALPKIAALAERMKPEAALWIIYPKGQKEITEGDVLSSGRAAGLKDIKVTAFSAAETALKFVVPVSRRKA